MKKVEEIPVAAIPATTRTVQKTFCDVPNCIDEVHPYKYGWGKSGSTCLICERDICKRHTVEDPDDGGDYPDKWCTVCYPLYYQRRRALENEYDKQSELLLQKVKKESLNKGA